MNSGAVSSGTTRRVFHRARRLSAARSYREFFALLGPWLAFENATSSLAASRDPLSRAASERAAGLGSRNEFIILVKKRDPSSCSSD